MQTYTHLLIGSLIGKLFFKDDIVIVPAVCAFGSIIPDIEAAAEYLKDKIQERKPFINTGEKQFFIINVLHSILLWILGLIASFVHGLNFASLFFIGGLCHSILDLFTHSEAGKRFPDTTTYLWPFKIKLGKYLAICEYRYYEGCLIPKPFEAIADVIIIAIICDLYL